MNTNYSRYPGPGDFAKPDDDDRIERRTVEIMHELLDDPQAIAEAADDVIGAYDYIAMDYASTRLGHPDDAAARRARFMDELDRKVDEKLREKAEAQAERESESWPSWREAHRNRMRSVA